MMNKAVGALMGMGVLLINPAIIAQEIPIEIEEAPSKSFTTPLSPVDWSVALDILGYDQQLLGCGSPGCSNPTGDRQALVTAIDNSLRYLETPAAAKAYADYPISGVTRDRVRRSLVRFRQLLLSAPSAEALQTAVKREFQLYQAAGKTNQGDVHFTGYFEPIYDASPVPTAEYSYPLYRKPANFDNWNTPHPTRAQLEGKDGKGVGSPLEGLELVWLRDRLEAFLVHIQGSAKLRFPDGALMSIGYAGKTDYPYTSIGQELVKDGIMPLEGLTLPVLMEYFQANPAALDTYLPRNKSFVFFRETNGAPATGSLGVPVTAERSIATDKSIMPPGALSLIHTEIPYYSSPGNLENTLVSRYVLDQDTGSAIQGAGRVDIFMGTGESAGDRAGIMSSMGGLYYLLLKQ
jgi:membrane-bound lytic murein transglycosylase A